MIKRNLKVGLSTMMFVLVGISVSAQERSEKRTERKKITAEEVFKQRDKNEDGKLEKGELIGWVSNDFAKLDLDSDGFLSLEEFSKSAKFQKRTRKGRSGERPNPAMVMERLDANSDGKISKEEAKGPLAEHFDRIDSNKDGFISKEEIENAPRRRGKRSQRRN